MKIKYEFANGETSEVEVEEDVGTLIIDSRKVEHAQEQKQRRHCISLDAIEYEGIGFADPETPVTDFERKELNETIANALLTLTEVQKRRFLLFADGMSIADIARLENTEFNTVKDSISGARKKLKNFFEK